MEAFESTIRAGVGHDLASSTIPGVIAAATNGGDELLYHNVWGRRSVDTGAEPLAADSVFWIASCTKLLTTIAAMQCVERGLLSLDNDISSVLPELREPNILEGFDDAGEPVLRKAKRQITLRLMLTHSAGMGFNLVNPLLKRYQEWRQKKGINTESDNNTIEVMHDVTLVYEPGEGWAYSAALDWTGKAIERVTKQLLGDYLEEHIFKPCGVKDLVFHLKDRPDMAARLVDIAGRNEDGSLRSGVPNYYGIPLDARGGGGLFSTPRDYTKILGVILRNDGTLVKPETLDIMFQSQVPDKKFLRQAVESFPPLMRQAMTNGMPDNADVTFGFGGLLNLEDCPGGRAAGSMVWGGAANWFWWVDRNSKIAGVLASQMLPFGDPKLVDGYISFERAIYSKFGSRK